MESNLAASYPAVPLNPSGSWWRRVFSRRTTACIHPDANIVLTPDLIRLRNGASRILRQPPRPEIHVCPACFSVLLDGELKEFPGRLIVFEPAKEGLTRLSYLEQEHFGDAPLDAEDLIHCQSLVAEPLGGCQKCGKPAMFLLLKRGFNTVPGKLSTFRGGKEYYCMNHGRERLQALLGERLPGKPVCFANFPYGERGVYIPGD